jgi:haloalkane dehalogenase
MDILRTPPECFDNLPDFPFEAHFHDWAGVRIARIDEGHGRPILMLHGQPTWSFLFRKFIPPLVAAGHRCIAPDLPGFGRSDKPDDIGWYSFERHVEAITSLVRALDLDDITLVLHDWGGPIGLRLATGELSDRIARIVAMETVALTGDFDLGEVWHVFRDIVAKRDPVPCGRLVKFGCRTPPARDVVGGYDAPFPTGAFQAGVRAFPPLVPQRPDDPGARLSHETVAALAHDERPVLLMWGEFDPIFPLDSIGQRLRANFRDAPEPLVISDAGHFVFEDQGAHVAATIADWLSAQEPAPVA